MAPEGKPGSGLGRSLADQIKDLEDPTPKDFDPEDQDDGLRGDEDSRSVADESAGREHYEEVGKGKLRKPATVKLGKQYAGSRVSRADLEAESDDDPFAKRSEDERISDEEDDDENSEGLEDDAIRDEDDDIDSADAFGESDEERFKDFKFRASKQSRPADADEDEDQDEDEDDDDDDEEGADASVDGMETDENASGSGNSSDALSEDEDEDDLESDLSDDEDDDDAALPKSRGDKSDEREELRKLMATDQKTIAATISQAAKADAAKGMAVKQQRSTFDALLNTRIKLQKGLAAVNEIPVVAKEADSVDQEAVRSAESAALALWSTLEDLRLALADAQSKDPSKKRKRPSPVSSATSSASLWKRMMDLESESFAHRRAILDKWSLKVRGSNATLPNARGKLLGNGSGAHQTITAVLDAHIATESGERAAKRSRKGTVMNGSASAEDEAPEPIYDDTVFYQSLLRDLVEQRMSSSEAITNGVETLHIQLPTAHPTTGMRKDKIKKAVDTKASKGRKMRYTVHEKLQNFMAPEDRGTWTARARDEFFASLLGKTAGGVLREEEEDEDVDQNGGGDSDEDKEERGLRLFRS